MPQDGGFYVQPGDKGDAPQKAFSSKPKLVWEDTVEDRARAVVECWIEDCLEFGSRPACSEVQERRLLRQIEVAIHAQRTEWQEVTE